MHPPPQPPIDALPGPRVTEPVWWGARLAVVADVRYTEVAGNPVVVVPGERPTVLVAGVADAVLLTRLDGRPLDEVLVDELATWDGGERRRVRDVLRRYKAMGVLEDADPTGPPSPVGWTDSPPRLDRIEVRGALGPCGPGPGPGPGSSPERGREPVAENHADQDPDPQPILDLTRVPEDTVADTVTVIRTPDGRVSIGGIRCSHGPGLGTMTNTDAAPEMAAFTALVGAVRPISDVRRPGVVDLCASLAESVSVEVVATPRAESGPRAIDGAGS